MKRILVVNEPKKFWLVLCFSNYVLLARSHFFFNSGFKCCCDGAVFNCSGRRFQAIGSLFVIEVLPRLRLYRGTKVILVMYVANVYETS